MFTNMFIVFVLVLPSVRTIALDIRYPQFFHQSLNDSSIEITEGKSAGSFIAFINLVNTSNASLVDWSMNTTESDFRVITNGHSYSLITTDTLDRERRALYEFTVYAQHKHEPYELLAKSIRIRLLDVNDCVPIFNQTSYEILLTSNRTHPIVPAFDNDQPNNDNSRISYSLSNYQDLFRIDESTGVIDAIKNLPIDGQYETIVVARDHGKPSLSSACLVQIRWQASVSLPANVSSWSLIEHRPDMFVILVVTLAGIFVCSSLFMFVLCLIHYRTKKRNSTTNNIDDKFSSTSTIQCLTHEQALTSAYDALHIFPNTYYLPLQEQVDTQSNVNNSNNTDVICQQRTTSSSTSSPVSAADHDGKTSSDDGCYCSSDMSSDQSNHFLLLNPSSLTTTNKLHAKQVRFNDENIDGILKRFEHLYEPHVHSSTSTVDPCASYV
jgi:hypothetical protein